MRKPAFCICENKDADQLRGNRKADQRLCFRYKDSQSLYFLNLKFQASSYPLWLHSAVCVGPGRKPRRPVFSQRGSCYHVWYQIESVNEYYAVRFFTGPYFKHFVNGKGFTNVRDFRQ